MSSRVLITGSQGFVGRYALAHWIAADPDVTVVGVGRSRRLSCSFTHHIEWRSVPFRAPLTDELRLATANHRYRYTRMDIRNKSALADLLKEVSPSVILHLAGALRDEPANRLFSLNVLGTEALFEAIAASGIPPPTVVLGSTGALYGQVPADRIPIREDEPASPFDLYSASKEAAERVARILSARHRIPTIYARIFNVVGPGQDERHLCGWLARQMVAIRAGVQQHLEVGPLDTARDFVDVRDVASALAFLAERGSPGKIYNVATGVETPVREVFDQLLEMSGLDRDVEILPRPARPSDCPRLVADVSELKALGYEHEFDVHESLSDVLHYYTSAVARNGKRDGPQLVRAATRGCSGWDLRGAAQTNPYRRVQTNHVHQYEMRMVESLLEEGFGSVMNYVAGRRALVVCTPTVAKLYGRRLYRALRREDANVAFLVLRCSEATKTVNRVVAVCRAAQRAGLDRRAVLIGVGGGVVTDIVTMAASWIRRGIEHVRIPTTLIGQVDAGVGIKGAVNLGDKKSYIGVFYPPSAVLIDTAFLGSLPAEYIRYGLAEIIKIALVRDPQLFGLVEGHGHELVSTGLRRPASEQELVWRSVIGMVEELEPNLYEDRSYERLVDFGHTFSPALESASGYTMHHGEAVAVDMALSAAIAMETGMLERPVFERILSILARVGLPTSSPLLTVDRCESSLAEAARHRGGFVNLVVPTAVGDAAFLRHRREIPAPRLKRAIELLANGERELGRRPSAIGLPRAHLSAAGL
jgi:3-dehydroquinate synthetase/nucleoside-diphosphate-sugar epimerase